MAQSTRHRTVEYTCQRCGVTVIKRLGYKQYEFCRDCYKRHWLDSNLDRRRELNRSWKARNRERISAQTKARREADPEKFRAACRRYRLTHREKVLAREREYDAKRAEYKRQYARQWQKDNPARHAANERARRAKQAGLFVEYVHPLAVLEFHDGICGICGLDVDPGNFHVDHIIPIFHGGEHSYANTQPAHPACNMAKGTQIAA
jgi:5-methylcytosine-specific restriction endonuclease McrA